MTPWSQWSLSDRCCKSTELNSFMKCLNKQRLYIFQNINCFFISHDVPKITVNHIKFARLGNKQGLDLAYFIRIQWKYSIVPYNLEGCVPQIPYAFNMKLKQEHYFPRYVSGCTGYAILGSQNNYQVSIILTKNSSNNEVLPNGNKQLWKQWCLNDIKFVSVHRNAFTL